MRVVTWNMQRRRTGRDAAWRLLDDLQPDIALLQEASPPPEALTNGRVLWSEIGEPRRWGSAVYVGPGISLRPLEFPNLYPGWVVAGEATMPDGLVVTAISVHAKLESGYSITTMHRILSDLTMLLDKRRRNVVFGGDFNASLQWDTHQGSRTHRILFDRVEAFGLKSCLDLGSGQQTCRMKNSPIPWQLDHLFASERMTVEAAVVWENCDIQTLSDHNPVVVELSAPAEARAKSAKSNQITVDPRPIPARKTKTTTTLKPQDGKRTSPRPRAANAVLSDDASFIYLPKSGTALDVPDVLLSRWPMRLTATRPFYAARAASGSRAGAHAVPDGVGLAVCGMDVANYKARAPDVRGRGAAEAVSCIYCQARLVALGRLDADKAEPYASHYGPRNAARLAGRTPRPSQVKLKAL